MNISIFGLGYVGAVSIGCFSNDGHQVVGVDISKTKIDLINKGASPIIEPGIEDLISAGVAKGRLRATQNSAGAVQESDVSIICVGTPSQLNSSLDLKYVRIVCEEIGKALEFKKEYHLVVIRSTMLPGSMDDVVIPTLEDASGKQAGVDFGVCINPEFLREGTAVYDFNNPPKIVIGEFDARSGGLLAELYKNIEAPLIRTDICTAEMVKYVDNVWHALKVGFANEIGNICKSVDIDSHAVMDIFCQDTKLNLSPYYLKPGFAFGGSCLPKDVRALVYKAKRLELDLPILQAIMLSNRRQIERGLNMITEKGMKKIGVLGISFKAGTDDLRESPLVEVIERLIGKGYEVRIFDRNVSLASLYGANRDYILNQIPHISKLIVDKIDDVLEYADTVVVGNNDPEFKTVVNRLSDGQVLVDLVRVQPLRTCDIAEGYDGICW